MSKSKAAVLKAQKDEAFKHKHPDRQFNIKALISENASRSGRGRGE